MKVRARYFVALAVIILSQVVSLFGATAAYADKLDGPYIDTAIVNGIKQWDYRDAIVSCFAQGAQRSGGGLYTLSLDELNSGKWFHDKSERVSYYSDPSDGTWTCKEDVNSQLSAIIKALGWDAPLAAACALGYKQINIPKSAGAINDNVAASRASSLYTEKGFDLSSYDKDLVGGEITTPTCGTSLGGDSSYIYFGAPYANETNIANISKAVDAVRKSTNNLSDAQQYAAGWEALRLSCKLTTGSGDGLYEVKGPTSTELIDGSGAASTTNKVNVSVINQDGSISYVLFPVSSPKSSIDIAPRPGYENQGWGINFNSCDSLAAFVNQKAAAYQSIIRQSIEDGSLSGNYTGTDPTGSPESKTTCAINWVGWIVCPAANFLGKIADGSMGILNKSFEVQADKLFDTSSSNQAYAVWQQIRNYANILFVIAFLIIIFSQITSIGITNYGIKKLLPKLIVTAILVNVSFPICALLVDLSNLLGYGLATFLNSAITVDTGTANDVAKEGSFFTGIITTVLSGVIAGAFLYFSLSAVLGLLISVVVIGVTMVVLLGVRQALIVLLVVLAPLAFVAMLLPNTNSLFKKWKKMLQDMLLIFPIASLLYGAGKLADQVLTATSDDTIVQTLAAALPILSLVGVYQLFKKAMTGLEGLGGAIGNLSNGIGKGVGAIGNPLKNLAGAQDKLNRQRFLAGNSLPGTRRLGRFVNRRKASYDTKMQTNKDEADSAASQYISQNKKMQGMTNRSAAANLAKNNAQQYTSNVGRQHVLDEHQDMLEEAGKLKEREREIEEKEQTVKIDASGIERSLADIAAKMRSNTEADKSNESKEYMQQHRSDLITNEGRLAQATRRIDNAAKAVQASDTATQAEFQLANRAELDVKEAETTRDANWQEVIENDEGLRQQQVVIAGQEMRGEAAKESVNASVKEAVADGSTTLNTASGQIDIRSVRDRAQEASMSTKEAEADIQAQEDERAATQQNLIDIANRTKAQQNRAGEAKRVQTANYRGAVLDKNSTEVVNIAGGTINPAEGQQRAQAAARAEVDRARTEEVNNARVRFADQPNNSEILEIATGERPTSSEEREAAVLHIMEKGSHDEKLAVIASAANVATAPDQRTRSVLADQYAKSPLSDLLGKGLAGEIREGAHIVTDAEGNQTRTSVNINQTIANSLKDIKAETIAGNSNFAKSLAESYRMLLTTNDQAAIDAAQTRLKAIFNTIRTTPQISGQLTDASRQPLNEIASLIGAPTLSPDNTPGTTAQTATQNGKTYGQSESGLFIPRK